MALLRQILCATDIEQPARAALGYSFFLAERFHASLDVVHVAAAVETARSVSYLPQAERIERLTFDQHVRERLDALVRTVPTGIPGRATTHVVDGQLPQAIADSADRLKSNLILLGATLRSTSAWHTHEPLSTKLATITLCPVLTVPDAIGHSAAPRLERILLPVEPASSITPGVTDWTALIARRFGAIVELLTPAGDHLDRCRAEIEDALRTAGVSVQTASCPEGESLTDAILTRVHQARCDLVVMTFVAPNSTLGRAPAQTNTVTDIRRRGAVPVLSVRAIDAGRLFVDGGFEAGWASEPTHSGAVAA